MEDGSLSSALDRAEKALARIEHSLAGRERGSDRDSALRERVREVVAELDNLIREAADG